jgi:hypothetical protein
MRSKATHARWYLNKNRDLTVRMPDEGSNTVAQRTSKRCRDAARWRMMVRLAWLMCAEHLSTRDTPWTGIIILATRHGRRSI